MSHSPRIAPVRATATERITEIAGLRITENTDLLCVGTDSLLCAAYVRGASKAKAVELGAGNGIISLLCLMIPSIKL